MKAGIAGWVLSLAMGGLLAASPATAAASGGVEAYRALGVKAADVLTGTVLQAAVFPGTEKQVVCVVTYFTGKQDRAEAVNIRFGIFERREGALRPLLERDLGSERGGSIANGDLQLFDLDADGVSEIILSYDTYEDPLLDQRLAEVILLEDGAFRTAWSGAVEYDATRAAREIPADRRDRYRREFDLANTLRTRGVTLFIRKTMLAVAGERLGEPKLVEETFPLRPQSTDW